MSVNNFEIARIANNGLVPGGQAPETGPGFAEIAERIHRHRDALNPVDRITKLPSWQIIPPEDGIGLGNTNGGDIHLRPMEGEAGSYRLLRHAGRQLLSRLRYPADLLERLPQKNNFLNLNILNQRLARGEADVQLRTIRGSDVRAIVSDRYTPLDDVDIIDALEPVLASRDGIGRLVSIGDEATHIRISFPEQRAEIRPGDIVERALHITNSEVGGRAFRIEGVLVRLRCTNGLRSSEFRGGFVLRHIGDASRLRDRVRGAIVETLREIETDMDRLLQRFRASMDVAIPDMEAFFSGLAAGETITKGQFKDALNAWAVEPDGNLFGAVNAITRAAQGYDPETRYELEGIAGNILSRGLSGSLALGGSVN